MPRRYRGIILAACGCLAVFALGLWLQPKQPNLSGDRGYQEQPASYRAGGAECEPSALNRLPARQRSAKTDACHEAEEQHREATNSLIEARRSADAADASTIAAYKQAGIAAWGTALGLATLLAAIAAAYFAKIAAEETGKGATAAEASVNETRSLASMQFQPKLQVRGFDIKFKDETGDETDDPLRAITYNASCLVENIGDLSAETIRTDLVVFACRNALPSARPYEGGSHNPAKFKVFEVGSVQRWGPFDGTIINVDGGLNTDNLRTYVAGRIAYRKAATGKEKSHSSAARRPALLFCRELKAGRWIKVPDPDYENE